ncbi:MAG: hypothetical protein JEY96_19445 [Bacteroidales bacterium]|nr:hypothetical protein [Bacteroidales bacterium]
MKVIAGTGVVYNNDTIFLEKTNIKETCRILKIADQTDSEIIYMTMWDGFDSETGESISGAEWTREIKHNSLVFEFASENDKNNLELRFIEVKENVATKVYTDTGFELGEINPDILGVYSEKSKHDYVSDNKLTYNLFAYGISFQFEQLENGDKKLVEITTHRIFE